MLQSSEQITNGRGTRHDPVHRTSAYRHLVKVGGGSGWGGGTIASAWRERCRKKAGLSPEAVNVTPNTYMHVVSIFRLAVVFFFFLLRTPVSSPLPL